MKLATRMLLRFIAVTLLVGGFGFYMFSRVSGELSSKQAEINQVTRLSEAALDFSTENYHTQLEVWEYAYQPTEKRLDAFYGHEITFDELFADFVRQAHAAGLGAADRKVISDLEAGIPKIKATWVELVDETEQAATGTVTKGSRLEADSSVSTKESGVGEGEFLSKPAKTPTS